MSGASPPRPARFALVAFDLDGVLVDTSPCHSRAYAELWEAIGVEGPAYAAIAGRRTAEVVAEVTRGRGPSEAELAAWVRQKQERARALVASEPIVFPDAPACVRALAAAGLRLAVGTAASAATAALALERLGVAGAFERVVAAEQVASGKPAPEVYARIAADARVAPESMLVVEDSAAGLAAAEAAGAWVACVRTGLASDAPRFFGSFTDLAALCRALGAEAA